MTWNGLIQVALFCGVLLLLIRPLGGYMARIFSGDRVFLSPLVAPVEYAFYRLAGIDPAREQNWHSYGLAMLLFNGVGFLLLYALLRLQAFLPLDPQGFGAL